MTIDEALTEFAAAWNTGMAPSPTLYLELVDAADRDTLSHAIGTWLENAPTIEPHPARAEELLSDPLAQRLAKLEAHRWEQRDGE